MTADVAAASFQAIGSEARLSVLRAIVRAGDGGMPVGAIQAQTGIKASTLSHHIRMLLEAGVVTQEKDGRATITKAAYDHLRDLSAFILLECCMDAANPDTKGENP